ncbi:hypothetical protein ACEUC8_20930, partial [Aeromonas veronii]
PRLKVFLAGVFVNIFSWGVWWMATSEVYNTFSLIANGSALVKINIVGLWVSVGFIGVGLFSVASPGVALFTGKRADAVWGRRGSSIANYVIVFFAIIGVFSAIYFYTSMTTSLADKGYVYCRPLTKFSATGRHEVYVANPALCVQPNKIP